MFVCQNTGPFKVARVFFCVVSQFFGLGSLLPLACGASPPPLEDVLRSMETAGEGIQSYDLYLKCTRHWPLKSVVVGTKKEGPREVPITKWAELEKGEQPKIEVFLYRQVLAPGGKRRIERLDPKTEEGVGSVVSDGEVMRRLDKPKAMGSISSLANAVEDGHDYLGYLGNPFASGSIVEMTRERKSRVLPEDSSGMVAFEARPGGLSYASFGWRVWLDPEHGLLPARIERYRRSMEGLYSRTEVHEFHQVEAGVWAPVDVTIQYYAAPGTPKSGKVTHVIHAVVDQKRSRWNLPLEDETFRLAFPAGTRVHDTVRHVAFVAGKGDTGKSLEDLMKNARDVAPIHDAAEGQVGPPSGSWTYWRWGLAAFTIVMVAIWLVLIVRKRWQQAK